MTTATATKDVPILTNVSGTSGTAGADVDIPVIFFGYMIFLDGVDDAVPVRDARSVVELRAARLQAIKDSMKKGKDAGDGFVEFGTAAFLAEDVRGIALEIRTVGEEADRAEEAQDEAREKAEDAAAQPKLRTLPAGGDLKTLQ